MGRQLSARARRGARIIAGLLALGRAARADPVHHNEVLVGGRALGMGGAATGLAEDAASVYYNPAGIAQMRTASLSASFQLDTFQKVTIGDGLRAAGLSDLKDSESPSLAVYVSAIAKVGAADESGFRRHALAFSTVRPEQQEFSFTGAGQFEDNFADLRVDRRDSTVWRGLTYAYSLSPRWALGLSAFWSHRELEHREAWIIATGVQPDASYTDPSGAAQSATLATTLRGDLRDVKLTADAAVLRLGVRYELTPNWRLGLMLQPPGIGLSASAQVTQVRLSYGVDAPGAPLPTYFRSRQAASASSPIPWELRLGGAYLQDGLTVGLDVMLDGPVGSASDPVVAVGAPAVDEYFGQAPAFPYLLATRYHSELVGNIALGVEGIIADVVPWAAGVFTDLSAAPSVPESSDNYAFPDVDRFGFSTSVGWRARNYNLQVGGAVRFGNGDALVLSNQPDSPSYATSSWKERTIFFFITGYQRAAEAFAKSAAEKVLQ